MIRALALAALLAGCTAADQDQVARAAAKAVVTPVAASQFPGVPADKVSDCVIDNASAAELVTIGASAATGSTATSGALISEILARPATVRCIADASLPGT